VIESLLPANVASRAVWGDDPQAVLFPEEAGQIQGAVDSRSREFATGRSCARAALRRLGVPPVAILRGPKREPVWPACVVGSITHCSGYRAAAAAMRKDVMTIGIDAEPHEPLPVGILQRVAIAQEEDWLTTAPSGINWDRVLFSAKESVFKAWFPLARTWLGFEQALVTFEPAEGIFHARLLVSSPPHSFIDPTGFHGRFLVRAGLILTAIVVPRRD
jgi:4'-phosphopantetheinyl transferase EntD